MTHISIRTNVRLRSEKLFCPLNENNTPRRKARPRPPPAESGEASKVMHDEQTVYLVPNGGPHLELGRLRLKTCSIAETTGQHLCICVYMYEMPGIPQAALRAAISLPCLYKRYDIIRTSTQACTCVFCVVLRPLRLGFTLPLSEVDPRVNASTAALSRGKGSLLGSMCYQPSGWDAALRELQQTVIHKFCCLLCCSRTGAYAQIVHACAFCQPSLGSSTLMYSFHEYQQTYHVVCRSFVRNATHRIEHSS